MKYCYKIHAYHLKLAACTNHFQEQESKGLEISLNMTKCERNLWSNDASKLPKRIYKPKGCGLCSSEKGDLTNKNVSAALLIEF